VNLAEFDTADQAVARAAAVTDGEAGS
jgi:hypothetical protein